MSPLSSASWAAFPGVPSLGTLAAEAETLERRLSAVRSPVVLCHNDLLIKNIIYNQSEGEEEPGRSSQRNHSIIHAKLPI